MPRIGNTSICDEIDRIEFNQFSFQILIVFLFKNLYFQYVSNKCIKTKRNRDINGDKMSRFIINFIE